ncbi:MAG: DUF72 domain-containing protein, partial [Nitrospirota bacterium]
MIRVGTCLWTEKTLIQSGEFYPKTVKTAEERLRYCASSFDTVEVDSTYYASPDMRNSSLWVDRTLENFIFCNSSPPPKTLLPQGGGNLLDLP